MTDAEWAEVRSAMPVPAGLLNRGGRPEAYCHREMLDAVRYVVDNGVEWMAMPVDYPYWRAVYDFFRRWRTCDYVRELYERLRRAARERTGRNAEPSAGIIDSQSVDASETVGEDSRGYDGGKSRDGRKRHVLPGFRVCGKLARRPSAVHASDHADALLSVKIGFNPFTGCLTSRWSWAVTLSPEISARIRDYRPRLPQPGWAAVAEQVRATVAATAPATCYEARRLLHALGCLALWADRQGLPREPGVWLRTETIDAFVLSGCTGLDGSSAQTVRVCLRRTREALFDILETWLYQRTGTHLADSDFTPDPGVAPSSPNPGVPAPLAHAELPPPRHPAEP